MKRLPDSVQGDNFVSKRQKRNLKFKAKLAAAVYRAVVAEIYCAEAIKASKCEESARLLVERALGKAK